MVVLLEIFGKRSAGASDDTIANVILSFSLFQDHSTWHILHEELSLHKKRLTYIPLYVRNISLNMF